MEAAKLGIAVVRPEQIISGSLDVSANVRRLKESGLRVFVSLVFDRDHYRLMKEAKIQGLYGPDYLWFCAGGVATRRAVLDSSGVFDPSVYDTMLGTIGVQVAGRKGESYDSKRS